MADTNKKRRQTSVNLRPAPKPRPAVRSADQLHRSQWDRLQMLIGDRLWLVVGLAVSSTAAALCEAGILAISAEAAAGLVSHGHQIQRKIGPLHLHMSIQELLIIGIGLAVARLILQVPISWLPAIIGGDVQASMRRRLLHAYLFGSWELQSQDREGHFQEMMTNQIMQASQGALQTTQLVTSLFTFVILVGSAFALNVIAAVTVFAMATLIIFLLRPARSVATRLAKMLSAAQLEYAGSVGETNRLTEESNVFGTGDEQIRHVDWFVESAREYFMKAQLLNRLVPNAYQSLIYFVLVFGLLAAELADVKGFTSLGAVVLLLIRAGTYGQQVQSAQVSLRQSLPFVERLQNVIDAYSASTPRRGTASLEAIRTVEMDAVEYYYAKDRPVLLDVSFEVSGGETIGIIGPSGAGKSTLVQILLRLREPRSGHFLVNGEDASEISAENWHERVAYVPQQPKLLHATVADNVRYFRDYDDAAVERACRLARIHDEIMSWPEGYQTVVGPRADAVSGGQQQRICLARALVSDPSLLVLDEPTSALDPRSESLIQESLESVRHELTLFIVAHRMSTLSICDRVMVVLDGKLNAFASLEELKASNDYYRFASDLSSGMPLAELSASTPADAELPADPPI